MSNRILNRWMGKPPPKRYRWWRFIEHSLPVIVIYLMVATLVELPDRVRT